MQDYHNIRVWRRAHALAINIRRTTRRMPRSGYGDLKTQMTSAAESIPMNIVEGCGASTRKEYARFLDIGIKSSSELEYQLELARDYGVLAVRIWRHLQAETVEVRKMLCGYRATVLRADARERSMKARGEKR